MGNAVQKEVEVVLDLDDGESLQDWARDSLNASPQKQLERRIRNKIRQGEKVANGNFEWSVGITTESDHMSATSTVTSVDEGDARHNGVQVCVIALGSRKGRHSLC